MNRGVRSIPKGREDLDVSWKEIMMSKTLWAEQQQSCRPAIRRPGPVQCKKGSRAAVLARLLTSWSNTSCYLM
ncbi:hypothetical protein DV515_00009147 [Chloebia gouldiae]|uniref:Uncharacterized protein n=1 Tax=Chloebia gouldiae TaxID=44316 RepID=A0A3L8SDF0_CHLGU|nr:hypothetical protein DV515_00009147 [Chloebia gouldiae]